MPAFSRIAVSSALSLLAVAGTVRAADYSCDGLVPTDQKLICSGFEPNWAIEFSCNGATVSANFIDAFSGGSVQTTPGTAIFSSQDPWNFETSHPVKGSIAASPGGCTDEGDNVRDFTFTPTAAPGLSGPFHSFCCRLQ